MVVLQRALSHAGIEHKRASDAHPHRHVVAGREGVADVGTADAAGAACARDDSAISAASQAGFRGRLTQRLLLATPQVAIFPHAAALDSAFRELFTRHRQAFKLTASVPQLSVALALVEKTVGLALITEPMARLYAKTFAMQVLPLPRTLQLPRVRVQTIWHERTHHDPACVWLREALQAVSREVPLATIMAVQ